MNDLRVKLVLEAEAASAQRAIEATQQQLRRVADVAREAGLESAESARRVADAYDRAAAKATAAMNEISGVGDNVVRTNQAVAGSAAQVGFQFNDIAMMWAAGQSPFMTAIQQGTQLTQILGGQGMAGAAATARAAFATMLNPFSIGMIAALTVGGMLVQWLFDAGEGAKSLEDRMSELRDAHKSLEQSAKEAEASEAALTAEFGAQAAAVRDLRAAKVELDTLRADQAERGAARGVLGEVSSGFSGAGSAADLFGVQGNIAQALLIGLQQSADAVDAAPDLEARITAMEELLKLYQDAAQLSGEVSEQEAAHLAQLMEAILAMRERLAQEEQSAPRLSSRMEGPGAGDLRTPVDVEANAELARATAELRAQAELQKVILLYGKDSVEAARARRDAERAVVEQVLAASNASEEQRRRYLAAWDAANLLSRSDMGAAMVRAAGVLTKALTGDLDGAAAAAREVAGADMSGNISAALGPAAALAARLWDAARGAAAAASTRVRAGATGANGPAFERGGRSGSSAGPDVPDMPTLDDLIERYGGAGGGGGGSGISAEAREAASLLRKAAEEAAREIETARDALVGSLKQGFTAPFADFISGAERGKEAFDDFGNFIQQKMAEIAANEVWEGLFAPLFKGMGGGGIGDLLGSVFFPGGLFGGAFAVGGAPLSSMANSVVGRPTPFRMGDGRIGVLGEEDDEAIMPLRGKGALAILPGMGEMRLPLARGAGGDLGIVLPPDLIAAVQPFARGGAPGRALAMLAAEVPGPRSGVSVAPSGAGGGFGGPRRISVAVNNSGEPMQAEAEVTETGDEIQIDVMLDRIESGLARRVMNRQGSLAGAMQTAFGLGRNGR